MSKFDYLGLDGRTLRTFLTVLEEKSVSRAAERLGVSQSAVSHTLDKLRTIFDDPLFIRIGRGIESTARARAMRVPIESVLDQLKSLSVQQDFDPKHQPLNFTIACNDFPLQLIFPRLLKETEGENIDLRLRFIPAGIPSVSVLKASRYRLLITPKPPIDSDLEKVSLLRAKMAVFYDSKFRKPPQSWKEYADAKRVEVRFSDTESSMMALPSVNEADIRPPDVSVPNFGSLAPMILNTNRITTQLAAMKLGLLKELDVAPLPMKTDPIDLFLVWHRREHDDPAHQWLRQKIIETVSAVSEKGPD
jgi:DNA-binding transcriptional LysR family regulator